MLYRKLLSCPCHVCSCIPLQGRHNENAAADAQGQGRDAICHRNGRMAQLQHGLCPAFLVTSSHVNFPMESCRAGAEAAVSPAPQARGRAACRCELTRQHNRQQAPADAHAPPPCRCCRCRGGGARSHASPAPAGSLPMCAPSPRSSANGVPPLTHLSPLPTAELARREDDHLRLTSAGGLPNAAQVRARRALPPLQRSAELFAALLTHLGPPAAKYMEVSFRVWSLQTELLRKHLLRWCCRRCSDLHGGEHLGADVKEGDIASQHHVTVGWQCHVLLLDKSISATRAAWLQNSALLSRFPHVGLPSLH